MLDTQSRVQAKPAPVQILVMQSHFAAHQRKFILVEGGVGYTNVTVVKSHEKIPSDLQGEICLCLGKFKVFIYLL